jgi:hypothetical protein
MEKVYLESSFISYLVSPPSRNLIIAAHQRITLDWWEKRRHAFWCCISETVLGEISVGDADEVRNRLQAVKDLPILSATEDAEALAEVILQQGIFPRTLGTDAAHIAIAAAHEVDYLLTWNCKHLANAQLIRRIRTAYAQCGVEIPWIGTPEELLGENDD